MSPRKEITFVEWLYEDLCGLLFSEITISGENYVKNNHFNIAENCPKGI